MVECGDKRYGYLLGFLKNKGLSAECMEISNCRGGTLPPAIGRDKTNIFLFAVSTVISKEIANYIPKNSIVFCFSLQQAAKAVLQKNNVKIFDYFDDEVLAVKNAYLTAEATLGLTIQNTDKSVKNLKVLVLGFGRVGKAAVKVFSDNGAITSVATIDYYEQSLAAMYADDVYNLCSYKNHLGGFDCIINTIPKKILNKEELDKVNKDCLVLDLASKPGGIDFEYAKKSGLNVIHALGLPGKYSPAAAGKILAESILNTLSIS